MATRAVKASVARDRLVASMSKKSGTSTHVGRIRYANKNSWEIEFSYVREAAMRILMRYRLTRQEGRYVLTRLADYSIELTTANFEEVCKHDIFAG